jgi:hypothetical protein
MITSKSKLSFEGKTLRLLTSDLDSNLKEEPQKWITLKSKLSFEEKTLRLYNSNSTFKE